MEMTQGQSSPHPTGWSSALSGLEWCLKTHQKTIDAALKPGKGI